MILRLASLRVGRNRAACLGGWMGGKCGSELLARFSAS